MIEQTRKHEPEERTWCQLLFGTNISFSTSEGHLSLVKEELNGIDMSFSLTKSYNDSKIESDELHVSPLQLHIKNVCIKTNTQQFRDSAIIITFTLYNGSSDKDRFTKKA